MSSLGRVCRLEDLGLVNSGVITTSRARHFLAFSSAIPCALLLSLCCPHMAGRWFQQVWASGLVCAQVGLPCPTLFIVEESLSRGPLSGVLLGVRTCPSEQAGQILEAPYAGKTTSSSQDKPQSTLHPRDLMTSEAGARVKLSHISPEGFVRSTWTLGCV